jgi:hypothetical protein
MADLLKLRGIATWEQLGPSDGDVLLIINSLPGDTSAVALAVSALTRFASLAALHVVADPWWGPWLSASGLPDTRVCLAAGDNGQSIELNHFLESPAAVLWIVPRQFRVIAGSAAHNLHNEEVKEIFEQRVSLLIGDGRFLAHALPHPYLAILDLADLVRRFGRQAKTDEYLARCRSYVQHCYATWVGRGSPARSDDGSAGMVQLFGEYFGRQILDFDEASPTPLSDGDDSRNLEALGLYYRTVLHSHDETMTALYRERVAAARTQEAAVTVRDAMLAELQAERAEAVAARDALLTELRAERNQAVALRDGMLAAAQVERNEAVGVRDAIIADQQRDIDVLTHGWRRWVVKRRR